MIRRTYRCSECAHEWNQVHTDAADPIPECPICDSEAGQKFVPVGVKSNKSRAMDYTQAMMEDQGYSNFKDNQRAGDIAAMGPPPMHTGEREAISRQMVEAGFTPLSPDQQNLAGNFWNNAAAHTGHADPMIAGAVQQAVAAAPQAATEARRAGVDPVALLNAPGRPGIKLDVVSAVKGN